MPAARRIPPELRAAVLAWYAERGRVLPFRGTRDPYRVLVSEVMAQQTQIARASEAWTRFVERFPSFAALAAASPAEVLREWRGLGYNRRAINLQRTARAVVEEHGGELPRDLPSLTRLPGIGPYTARAVAAIAFGQPYGAVDTNVRRVLGRVVAGDVDAVAPGELQRIADAAVPVDRPGEWTHALMDVGATFCRPARPRCGECPARPWCAFARRRPEDRRSGRRAREPGPAFHSTSRWLRGRILDRLRDAPAGDWVALREAIGAHDAAAVERALSALSAEGLAERHATDSALARLPSAD